MDAFECLFKKRKDVPVWVYHLGVPVLAVLIYISNHFFSFGMLNAVGMIAAAFGMSFLYQGKLKIKVCISIVGILLLAVVEIIVLSFVTLVFHVTVTEAVDNPSLRLFGMITSKMFTFAIIKLMCINNKNHTVHMDTTYWFLFSFIFMNSILAVFLIFKLR